MKLNAAAVAALDDPVLRQRLIDLGQDIPPREQRTPEALRAFQKAEIEKWANHQGGEHQGRIKFAHMATISEKGSL